MDGLPPPPPPPPSGGPGLFDYENMLRMHQNPDGAPPLDLAAATTSAEAHDGRVQEEEGELWRGAAASRDPLAEAEERCRALTVRLARHVCAACHTNATRSLTVSSCI